MGALARREPTMALHVHVAMPDGEAAVRALDGLRHDLPLLLALSQGTPHSGAAPTWLRLGPHADLLGMFPRVGIPRRFGTYATYVRGRPAAAVRRDPRAHVPLVGRPPAAAARDHRGPDHGRADAGGRHRRPGGGRAVRRPPQRRGYALDSGLEVLAENHLAARDGMEAMLIDADRVR